jgi:hypothetical protein
LATVKEPMNCKAMVESMQAKSLWTSPGGKTPEATLYASIIREIAKRGKESRFKKADRGMFSLNRKTFSLMFCTTTHGNGRLCCWWGKPASNSLPDSANPLVR